MSNLTLIYLLVCLFVCLFVCLSVRSFFPSFVQSVDGSFVHSFGRSFIYLFIYLFFIYLFIYLFLFIYLYGLVRCVFQPLTRIARFRTTEAVTYDFFVSLERAFGGVYSRNIFVDIYTLLVSLFEVKLCISSNIAQRKARNLTRLTEPFTVGLSLELICGVMDCVGRASKGSTRLT